MSLAYSLKGPSVLQELRVRGRGDVDMTKERNAKWIIFLKHLHNNTKHLFRRNVDA